MVVVVVVVLVGLAGGVPDAHAESISAETLRAQIDAGTAPPILDVRSAEEYARDHVPGAHHAPVRAVTEHATRLGLDPKAPVVVYCEHGPRAWMARTALRWAGFTDVRLLAGHMSGWRKSGPPVEPTTGPSAEATTAR